MYKLIIFVLILSFISCTKQDSFTINGRVLDGYTGQVFIDFEDKIDSTLVENAKFQFKGMVSKPTECFISRTSPYETLISDSFILENSTISIQLKPRVVNEQNQDYMFLEVDSVEGSESNTIVEDFESKIGITAFEEVNEINKKEFLYNNLLDLITKYPKSFISGKYLNLYTFKYDYLDKDQITTLYNKLNIETQDPSDIKNIKDIITHLELVEIGKEPPYFALPNVDNEIINLDLLDKDIVLLEFWASWCSPCRKMNPQLTDIYEEFKGMDFEIVGISIDTDKEKWKTAIKQDGLEWPQVIDIKNQTYSDYQINQIPFNLLVKDKRIIARNIKPTELKKILLTKEVEIHQP